MDELEKLLRQDSIDDAERMTGGSVSDRNSFAHHLALENHLERARKLDAALDAADDTKYCGLAVDFLRIAGEIGFQVVHEEVFKGRAGYKERFFFLQKGGALIFMETYRGDGVNKADVYYNLKTELAAIRSVRASGCWARETLDRWVKDEPPAGIIWVGHTDVRVALRHEVAKLERAGTFVDPWVERGFLLFRTYADLDNGNFQPDKITEARIRALPAGVRKTIGG